MIIKLTEIAIYLNENDETESIFEKGKIKVFSNVNKSWKIEKEIPFNVDKKRTPIDLRRNTNSLIKDLGDCKIIVFKNISGLPYTILRNSEFIVAEADGSPFEILDDIVDELKVNKESLNSIEPIPMNKEGYYILDLNELQKNNNEVTSKQALLPFLQNKKFYELQVICSHIPPWFEEKLDSLNMNQKVTKNDTNNYKVIISPKTCTCK